MSPTVENLCLTPQVAPATMLGGLGGEQNVRITKKAVAGVAAVALAGGGGVLVMTSADAAETPEPGARTLAAGSAIGEGSIQGWHLKNGTIYGADINPDVVKWFTGTYNNTVTTDSVKDGALGAADLNADLKGKLDNGKGVGTKDFAATAITTIGGSFATAKTVVGTVEVEAAGTYLVNTSAVFDRKNEATDGYLAPTTDTYPSLVVRYGDDYESSPVKFGVDAGTIMGSPVSRKGFVELTGSSTKTITVEGPTTLKVYGFGYNEDRSGFGGGQITVAAQVTVVKIG